MLLLLGLLFAGCVVAVPGVERRLAPLLIRPHSDEFPAVNNSYIVVLKDDTPFEVQENHLQFLQAIVDLQPLNDNKENGLKDVYWYALKGYSGSFSMDTLNQIRRRPEVNYVEEDRVVKTQTMQKQRWAPWGLSRLGHRRIGNGEQIYDYDSRAGVGTCVYVVDSGVDVTHFELSRNSVLGINIRTNEPNQDYTGHGTHVAGIIGSNTFGVAKRTKIIAVKVFDKSGGGLTSYTISGLEWVFKDKQTRQGCSKGSVINMSLASTSDRAMDDATHKATTYGIHTVVAAGNFQMDACGYSPARTPSAITVGATNKMDMVWSQSNGGSNWGTCVDIFAPGADINSTVPGQKHEFKSGTSMASPFVAGLVAYLLSLHPDITPQNVSEFSREWPIEQEPMGPPGFLSATDYNIATAKQEPWTTDAMQKFLVQISTKNAIKNLRQGTVNYLAYNNNPG